MKIKLLKYLLLLLINPFGFCFGQQKTNINATLDTITKSFKVNQFITFKNSSKNPIKTIVLNDWINAYSDKNSALGKRFSDEFIRSFHLAKDADRGKTNILSIQSDQKEITWNRIKDQVDLIELQLENAIPPQDSITVELNYTIKIPNARFTGYGYKNGNIYFNNPFLSIARLNEDGSFCKYSNKNLEDMANANYLNASINIIVPDYYSISSNLIENNITNQSNQKTYNFSIENDSELRFAIEKKSSFEVYNNDILKVETNLTHKNVTQIEKAIVIDKVIKFVNLNIGHHNSQKILVTQIDYDRNPIYGLNQLPSFLSPFQDNFIYEIKFLNAYLLNYLKASLKIDNRKDSYIIDAYLTYFLIKYIQENYPDEKIIGSLSKYKILKSYYLSKLHFNEQYNFLYLFMARKNLDQALGNSKDTFIKFNEQISNKDKAGACFYYLDQYLEDHSVEKSFQDFIKLNSQKQTSSIEFESAFKSNATKNIDWFFPNFIHSNNLIDYQFGSIKKSATKVAVIIKNNSENETSVPISISGEKEGNVIFEKWLLNIKKDTVLNFNNNEFDRLVLNRSSILPEFNARNNYKSFRRMFNKPFKFLFLKDIEDPKYNQIFYTPELGYNLYDGFLFSVTFSNTSLLNKPLAFFISPTYSAGTQSISGNAGIAYNQIIRNQPLYGITYALGASTYHYIQDATYAKFSPSLQFKFRDTNLISNERQFVSFSGSFINKEKSNVLVQNYRLFTSALSAGYSYQNYQNSKGVGLGISTTISNDFGKIIAVANYRKLFENNYQISLRWFNGYFLYNSNTSSNAFGLDTPKDVFFDYNLYGRSETTGFFSQQLVMAEGGFKSKIKNPYGDKWMSALNINSSIWHWIQLYGDGAVYQNSSQKAQFVYDSGVHFNILPDYFELFFPVYSSNGFELGQKNYHEKIRFIVTFSPNTLIKLFTRKWF